LKTADGLELRLLMSHMQSRLSRRLWCQNIYLVHSMVEDSSLQFFF